MKKRATDESVNAFMAALYPDAPVLAIAAFDEATVLAEATRQLRLMRWTLDNVYAIARREARLGDERERWGHVIRLCEKVGCQSRGVLRASEEEKAGG